MYPLLRIAKSMVMARYQSPLRWGQVHVSHHICWPWDLDLWMELNNGRTLTLYDLGRVPLAMRSGIMRVLAQQKWGMTMAGATVRYRRRIRLFERVEMRSRCIYADGRFVYIEQSMWNRRGDCANHIVYRAAFVDANGIVAPERLAAALGQPLPDSPPPNWLAAWIKAEDLRPWPPMQDDIAG